MTSEEFMKMMAEESMQMTAEQRAFIAGTARGIAISQSAPKQEPEANHPDEKQTA